MMGVPALFQLLNCFVFVLTSFEKISILDSCFIHRYIVLIKCRQVQFRVKSTNQMGDMAVSQLQKMFSVYYLLKRLVCWIYILYTGIYHKI